MAIIVAIAADHTREVHFLPALKRSSPAFRPDLRRRWSSSRRDIGDCTSRFTASKETGGADRRAADAYAEPRASARHARRRCSATRPTAEAANRAAMDRMHGPMMQGIANADPDAAFVLGMIPHHQGAIDMAEIVLKFGKDAQEPALRARDHRRAKARDRRDARMAEAEEHPSGEGTAMNGKSPSILTMSARAASPQCSRRRFASLGS